MAKIQFETGQVVEFDGDPTPQDVEEVATKLGIAKAPEAPKSFGQKVGGFVDSASQALINSNFPGSQIGQAVGNNLYGLSRLVRGDVQGFNEAADAVGQIGPKRLFGDAARSAALPASLALPTPTKVASLGKVGNVLATAGKNAVQGGTFGAISSGGESLAQGNSLGQAAADTLTGGAKGAATQSVFNLLGQGASAVTKKAGPTILSFTSGVPKNAIKQAGMNPEAARIGLSRPVEDVREEAVGSLRTLRTALSDEFASGLEKIEKTTKQTKTGMVYNKQGFQKSASEMKRLLTNYGREYAREFRIGTRQTPLGVTLDFSKSPIVSPGEARNVQEVFTTISTWDDFSARGLQDLAERVGNLRDFDKGGGTARSMIISKVYNRIAGTGGTKGLIPTYVPELAELRTNFAKNKKVLDEIGVILNETKKSPVSIQASVTRLDNLFRENRDIYFNAVKELSKRSGVDYLSLLAGGEFQRILPDFIRGLGGGAAVSVGASVLNPWLIILAPLFSPRFAGRVTRSASDIARTSAQLSRFLTTQAIREQTPGVASPPEGRTLP